MRRRIFSIFAFLAPAIIVTMIVGGYWIAPSGQRVVRWESGFPSALVHDPVPESRVQDAAGATVLRQGPIYVTVTPPPSAVPWDALKVQTIFTPGGQGVMELGLAENPDSPVLGLQTIWHRVLGELSWPSILAGDLIIWGKDGPPLWARDPSLTPPPVERVASVHAQWGEPYLRPRLAALPANATFPELRGTHTLLAYVTAEEEILLQMRVRDLNASAGEDTGTLRVMNAQGKELSSSAFVDDGVTAATGEPSEPFTRGMRLFAPGEGVLTITVTGSDDLAWEVIFSNMRAIVAQDRVEFVDAPAAVVTDALEVAILPDGQERRSVLASAALHEVTGLAGRVVLAGTGTFTPVASRHFDPFPRALPLGDDPSAWDIDAVIATRPDIELLEGDRARATASFGLAGRPDPWAPFTVVISLPGVERVVPEDLARLEEITLTFSRPAISGTALLRAARNFLYALLP